MSKTEQRIYWRKLADKYLASIDPNADISGKKLKEIAEQTSDEISAE